MKEYVCRKCGGTEYYVENDGYRRCKHCHQEKMHRIYASAAYKENHRISDRLRKYGCSREQYESSLAEQDGKCAICGKEAWENLRIDHDHETGKLRGLLCDNCNWGLGNFKDNPEILKSAIDYLAQYG